MYTVLKYPLEQISKQELTLPVNAKVFAVMEQYGKVILYALVDSSAKDKEVYTIYMYGTGDLVKAKWNDYIGTVMLHSGALVLHVFVTKY